MNALDYLEKNKGNFLKDFQNFLSIPTISSQKENAKEMSVGAKWLSKKLKSLGFNKINLHQTKSKLTTPPHPIITAEKIFSAKLPTILMYSHYDVQPVGNENEWLSPPFKPTIKNNRIYARGSSDNKGPLIMQLSSLECLIKTASPMFNIKIFIEGEEEIGSKNTHAFIQENQKLLECDMVLVTDTEMLEENIPAITLGVRGLAFLKGKIIATKRELHSGCFGGFVANPVLELMRIISDINTRDEKGRINLKGFYKGVKLLSREEKNLLLELPDLKKKWLKETGMKDLENYSPAEIYEKIYHQPTFEINGIKSGELFKTIIPHEADFSLSCRLVGEQNYEEIIHLVKQAITKKIDKKRFSIKWEEEVGGNPVTCDLHHPGIKKATLSLTKAFSQKPLFLRTGGSIPILAELKNSLQKELIMIGFSMPEDKIHSPNESFSLTNFYRGIQSLIHFLSY